MYSFCCVINFTLSSLYLCRSSPKYYHSSVMQIYQIVLNFQNRALIFLDFYNEKPKFPHVYHANSPYFMLNGPQMAMFCCGVKV